MDSANSRLKHSSAPHWNAAQAANIVYALGLGVAANAPQFHVDDLAGSEFDGGDCMPRILDAFIQADRRSQLRL